MTEATAALADMPAARAHAAPAEPATASVMFAGSLPEHPTRRQFPPHACSAKGPQRPEAIQLMNGERMQVTAQSAQRSAHAAVPSRRPAEFGSPPAARTQFRADCSGRQFASASASAGQQRGRERGTLRESSAEQAPANDYTSQAAKSGRQRCSQARSAAATPRSRETAIRGRDGVRGQRALRAGGRRSAAAASALLALCVLCLTGAATAAVVRVAVAGNAATSTAILVRAPAPHVRCHRSAGHGIPDSNVTLLMSGICCDGCSRA